ncbi:putative Glycosyl transferase [Magnetospirillum gryphiswaldense MSR-1 v2]|uniref:Glycosyl transferase n=1 Tax=Magnetospirillum gryphiswaldense (strain DSM 6361 / JCM 21280 / NBRC 15271 / MSR-1) TaxID=431944 RepID=V6F8Z8_MAGGM|nr:glycosyltransferase family A protein [Magnetospirillum gryphiswaldense]CDL01393.1 putative Glycosyl transferase [Magnetospirillum gryphiswaldense MSR-1 v2]
MNAHQQNATVAVITRTCNRPQLLERACGSVMAQSRRDFLWVLVNNGGDPIPVEAAAARAAAAGLAVQVHHIAAMGIEAASNHGIRHSVSTHVAIHDDDDCWEPEFLERTVGYLSDRSRLAGVATASTQVMERLDADGITILSRAPYQPWVRAIHLVDMAQRNLFPPIALLFRRDAWEQVGGFDEELPVLGDWDFNLKVLRHHDIGFIAEALANYHIRPGITDSADTNGNTITAGLDRFHETDPIIRNRLLRQDLDQGRIGLGWLVALGRQHQAMWTVLRGLMKNTKDTKP